MTVISIELMVVTLKLVFADDSIIIRITITGVQAKRY
jgi:hypothetical protein